MLVIDDRAGSSDLYAPLKQMGLPVVLSRTEFGDVSFEGKGLAAHTLDIGIEHKKLGELIQSIRDGRFAGHQLPGMVKMYDRSWLLVEGQWKQDEQGQLVVKRGMFWTRGGMTASEYQKHLLTFQLCGGIYVHSTDTRLATLHWLSTLYRWWTDRSLDAHTSHLAVHTPAGFLPISEFRGAVSRFPGIGLRASLAVEEYFDGSLERAVLASVDEWAGIKVIDQKGKGRRLGLKVAQNVKAFCKGAK